MIRPSQAEGRIPNITNILQIVSTGTSIFTIVYIFWINVPKTFQRYQVEFIGSVVPNVGIYLYIILRIYLDILALDIALFILQTEVLASRAFTVHCDLFFLFGITQTVANLLCCKLQFRNGPIKYDIELCAPQHLLKQSFPYVVGLSFSSFVAFLFQIR